MPFATFRSRASRLFDHPTNYEGGNGGGHPDVLQSSGSSADYLADGQMSLSGRTTSMGVELDVKERRFSRMRLRHTSDPQLSTRFKALAELEPPMPSAAPAPVVSYTSPKRENFDDANTGFRSPWSRQRSFRAKSHTGSQIPQVTVAPSQARKSISNRIFRDQSPRLSLSPSEQPAIGPSEKSRSSLALPRNRFSTSSTSDEPLYAATTTTYPNASTTTTFFKIRRKTKPKQDLLFPLSAQLLPANQQQANTTDTTSIRASTKPISPARSTTNLPLQRPHNQSPLRTEQFVAASDHYSSPPEQTRPIFQAHSTSDIPTLRIPTTHPRLVAPSSECSNPGLLRRSSTSSAPASPSMGWSLGRQLRKRSSTFDRYSVQPDQDGIPPLPPPLSGRTSVASGTFSRNSIGGLKSLTSRLRIPSEPRTSRDGSPGSYASPQDEPFRRSRETVVLPEREDGETAGRYFSRLEKVVPKRNMAVLLSNSSDAFKHDVLRSLMRSFKFYEVPLDLAIRQFLWEVDLPGEAQQIDRVISAFAERYHECNPQFFQNMDQVYLVAYSLIILHSDLFNKNNKRKMQKSEYQKNTGGQGIDNEILGYFYDNIQYTEFIAQDNVDPDLDNRPRTRNRPPRVPYARKLTADSARMGVSDPYDYILDAQVELERLRPSLQTVMNLDDTFNFSGTQELVDIQRLRDTFSAYATLEIVSARSRTFAENSTVQNPQEALPGRVAVRVVKVGLVWRKDLRRRKTQRPWQQWGAVLTPSQLYFFRDTNWTKTLITQYESHPKMGNKRLIFTPPLEAFKHDHSVPTPGMVALLDKSYDKHKNAFLIAREDEMPYEEILLADDETERNDWLAKINYASVFHWDTSSDCTDRHHDHNAVRQKVISAKLEAVQQKSRIVHERLEEHLRNARHLQILVPFPPKTRSELLTYGARVGVRIRWSRYALWRLKCEQFMLTKGLDVDASIAASKGLGIPKVTSPRVSNRSGTLSRWNSKASALVNPQKSKYAKSSGPDSLNNPTVDPLKDTLGGQIGNGVGLGSTKLQNNCASDLGHSYSLPILELGSGAFGFHADVMSERLSETPTAQHFSTPPINHASCEIQDSTTMLSSDRLIYKDVTGPPHTPITGFSSSDGYIDLVHTPNTTLYSPNSGNFIKAVSGSPESRQQRRSMPRTLRDSKDSNDTSQQRLWKGKEATTDTMGDEAKSSVERDGVLRRSGSGPFTLHGKKASVITLSPEWQHISAEERLRLRNKALAEQTKLENVDGTGTKEGPQVLTESAYGTSESNRTSYHSVLEAISPVASAAAHIDCLGSQPSTPVPTEIGVATSHYGTVSKRQQFSTSAARKLFDDMQLWEQDQKQAPVTLYGSSMRTFFEDASTTDDDPYDVHEQVGIALG